MPGPVLISSNTGSGHPADEALVAAALRLLGRGSWGRARLLTRDVAISAHAHPELESYVDEDIDTALAGCRLMLVVGGILWLLYTFGVFAQPVFPILMIILGLYFIIRNR